MALQLTIITIDVNEMTSTPKVEIFNQDIVTIGRKASKNDVVLSRAEVSSKHLQIRVDRSTGIERLFVTDFGSLNGTTLEGKLLTPNEEVEITSGQRIGLGSYIIRPTLVNDKGSEDGTQLVEIAEDGSKKIIESTIDGIDEDDIEFLSLGDDSELNAEEIQSLFKPEQSLSSTFYNKLNGEEDAEPEWEVNIAEDLDDDFFEEITYQEDDIQDIADLDFDDDLSVDDFSEKEDIQDVVVKEKLEELEINEVPGDELTEENDELNLEKLCDSSDDSSDEDLGQVKDFVEEKEERSLEDKKSSTIRNSEKGKVLSFDFDCVALYSISGRILYHGEALEGITVDLGEIGSVTTDEEGRFSVNELEEGSFYNISIQNKKFVFNCLNGELSGELNQDIDLEIEAKKLYCLKGLIKGIKENPIEAVTINAGEIGKTESNKLGEFEFSDVVEGTPYNLSYSKDNYIFECKDCSGSLEFDHAVTVKAILLLKIEGFVKRKGLPITGVKVQAGNIATTYTDENGYYCFKGIPEDADFEIILSKEGYKFSPNKK